MIFEDLKVWLREAWTAEEEQAHKGVENWKRCWVSGRSPCHGVWIRPLRC